MDLVHGSTLLVSLHQPNPTHVTVSPIQQGIPYHFDPNQHPTYLIQIGLLPRWSVAIRTIFSLRCLYDETPFSLSANTYTAAASAP